MSRMFFRRVMALLLIVVVSGGVLSACSAPTSVCPDFSKEGYTKYTSDNDGYSFYYPEGWTKLQEMSQISVSFGAIDDKAETFDDNMNIVVSKYTKANGNLQMNMDAALDALKKTPNFELISREEVTVSGIPAQKIVYTVTIMNFKIHATQVLVLYEKGERAYALTYMRDESRPEGSAKFDDIVSSFCIK